MVGVGGILGQHPGRVGNGNAFVGGGLDVDIVHAGAEIGDQFEVGSGLRDQRRVDAVGNGGNQDIGGGHGFGQLCRRHRRVVIVQPRVEQFAHARFHRFGQLAGDDDKRLLGHAGSLRAWGHYSPRSWVTEAGLPAKSRPWSHARG